MISKYDPKQTLKVLENIQSLFPRIQIQKVEELKALDSSMELFKKLLKIFHSESKIKILEMRDAITKLDVVALLEATHRFKSTTYNLGAARAAEITKAIENVASEQPHFHKDLELMIHSLEEECRWAHLELTNKLSSTKI